MRKEGKEQCHAIVLRSGKEIEKPKRGDVVTLEKEELEEEDKVEIESNKLELKG